MKLQVKVHNTQTIKLNKHEICILAKKVWLDESQIDGKIDIILINNDYIRKLNIKFLNKDSETDVIAFPLSENDNELFEGEIYVSFDKVEEQAQRFRVNPEEELQRLVIHGILHFLGYRDGTKKEKQTMINRENFYLGLKN